MDNKQSDIKSKLNELKKFISENLTYIITGLLILIITVGVLYNYYNNANSSQEAENAVNESVQQEAEQQETAENTVTEYVVQRGDNLWKIAEKIYGSGYNAVDLAKANKLSNPNLLFAGQKLSIPQNVPNREPTADKISTKETNQRKEVVKEYTVKRGDYLWKIAEEVYGDGFMWSKIAQANNLRNPDLLFAGQKLTIPQN